MNTVTFPEHLQYTREHEWVRAEGDIGVVGITDYAQGELSDIVFVELPPIGKHVKQGESFGTIEAVKAVSELYAPISGEVIEVNAELQHRSEVVNKEPYDAGWMIKIKMKDKREISGLLDVKHYRELIGK